MIERVDAIFSLVPDADVIDHGNSVTWKNYDVAPITEEQINAEVLRLQAEYDSKDYQRKRAVEYPPLTDLADAMYWAAQGDNTKLEAYYAACEAVKLKYPKVS